MKHAVIIWKCRRCGITIEGDSMDPDLVQFVKNNITSEHQCLNAQNETWGILDLIGYEIREAL
jgi:ribosomal protein L37AE/L43A